VRKEVELCLTTGGRGREEEGRRNKEENDKNVTATHRRVDVIGQSICCLVADNI